MGMLLSVYRHQLGDSTNNGVSSKYNELVVCNVDGPFDEEDDRTVVLTTDKSGNLRLTPTCIPEGKWTMFGGNYAGTSDSRWSSALRKTVGYDPRVVPIFDRVED